MMAILLAIWAVLSIGLGFLLYHYLNKVIGKKHSMTLFLSVIPGILILCVWYLFVYGANPSKVSIVITKPQSGYAREDSILNKDNAFYEDSALYVEGTVSPAKSTVAVLVRSETDDKWWLQSEIKPQLIGNGVGRWKILAHLGEGKEGAGQNFSIIAIASNDSPFFNFIAGRALTSKTYYSLPMWNKSEPVVIQREK